MKDAGDPREKIVYFPIHNFMIQDRPERVKLASGVWLQREAPALVDVQRDELGKQEQSDQASGIAYWLVVEGSQSASSSSVAHTWIFAVWLVRPTKASLHHAYAWYHTEHTTGFSRMLSRAGYNKFDNCPGAFSAGEIEQAIVYFHELLRIPAESRLGLALSLSVESTWTHRWSAGLLLAASAVESLLSFTTEGAGIAARLQTAYAGFMGGTPEQRVASRQLLQAAYAKRSNIGHGRLSSETVDGRLEDLAKWSQIMRGMWREVLTRSELFEALQGEDDVRKRYFLSIGAVRT